MEKTIVLRFKMDVNARTTTKRHYGFAGLKNDNEEFILSLENEWHERGKIELNEIKE